MAPLASRLQREAAPAMPAYRLTEVDALGRRKYEYLEPTTNPDDQQPAAAARPPLQPPPVEPEREPTYTGIHAIEVYVPRHCVSAAKLEADHAVVGKYTEGLMMRQWSAADEDEDVVSMALTCVRRLVESNGLNWEDIGFLNVGTESLLDRSKSIKSNLMQLFPPGVANVEGVDYYHACYGGTASLFACIDWCSRCEWDGRWAIAVCTDVSDAPPQYPFMNGAACVAMLVAPMAPLAMEYPRFTNIVHEWDFYKPVGWPTMGPIIDGPHSMEVYYKCLTTCQEGMKSKGMGTFVDDHDHLVFHLGSSPKFVKHAFEKACEAAHGVGEGGMSEEQVDERFAALLGPSLRLAARVGSCHTCATYLNLTSLLIYGAPAVGASIGVFSYGSGAASSMYRLRVRGEARVTQGLVARLNAREEEDAATFVQVTKRFSKTYGRFDWKPNVNGKPQTEAAPAPGDDEQ